MNAEYVKYSLSLIEKELYDKLGVKIETEVVPADAFVAKTLLEFNSGASPWDLVMFGPSNMPDYGRHFEPLEPWIEKLKLDFAARRHRPRLCQAHAAPQRQARQHAL